MYQRVVLLKMPWAEPADDARVAAAAREFGAKIPGVVDSVGGRDTGGQSGDWTHAIVTKFIDRQACVDYLPHPIHEAFSDWVFSHGDVEVMRIAFDI